LPGFGTSERWLAVNEENKKKPNILLGIVTHVIAFLLPFGAFLLGLNLKNADLNAEIWVVVCLVAIVLLCAGSFVGGTVMGTRLKKRSVIDTNAEADERMARLAKNPEKEWRRIRFACGLTVCYIIILVLLCLAVAFFYGATGYGGKNTLYILVPFFLMCGLVGRLLKPISHEQSVDALKEEEFPQLYALAKEVGGKKLEGKKVQIVVIHDIPDHECSAAVVVEKKRVIILLGAVLLCIVDEAELKQVLYHEIAHLETSDLEQDRTYGRIIGYLTSESHSIFGYCADLALLLPSTWLMIEGQLYFLLSNRMKEAKADDSAARQGEIEKQASVLAKIHAHDIYAFEQEPYVNIFRSETVPEHMMTERAEDYRAALEVRGAIWKEILEHELPSRVATHPTFRQRWEALGCCAYSMNPAPTDTDFAKECWAAAKVADAERASFPQEDYDDLRQRAYLKFVQTVEEYESSDRDWTPEQLREPMIAYFHVGEPEKLEALCDQIISSYDSPFATAFARYWKGILLLSRYDKQGLGYLYQAMEANTNYIEDALERIGRYCTRMGLQEELDEYRRRAPEFLQLTKDRDHDGITTGSKLSAGNLPEGWLEEILAYIQKVGGEVVQEVYLVTHHVTEDYNPSAFVLRFLPDAENEQMAEVYDKVFALLDDWPEDWEFSLYAYQDNLAKPLSTVKEALVYRKNEE